MIEVRLIWPPYPYKAGFCITDDTDAATFVQVKAVYDFLSSKSFVTTKTVWPFTPTEKCGIPPTPDSTLRGITLEDDGYLRYCKMLAAHGFEICLHGASAGNNRRERTIEAFDFLEHHIGSSHTFICHSKNADNMYWEEKVTSIFPFRQLLKSYSRHQCSGEIEGSPYYWGDECRKRVNNIRLYRTRCTNTLKRNPSMPYYDPSKPLVNGWFSATKRALRDCATEEALKHLKDENGLTVLYQYLHRYADSKTLQLQNPFVVAIERIADDEEILIATLSSQMSRLRQMQGLFILFREKEFWIVNANNQPVPDLQIVSENVVSIQSDTTIVSYNEHLTVVQSLHPKSITHFKTASPIHFAGRNAVSLPRDNRVGLKIPWGKLYVNLSQQDWINEKQAVILPSSYHLDTLTSGTGLPLLSRLSTFEEAELVLAQFWIIAREILLKGRSLSSQKYLDAGKEIMLENHNHW